MVDSISARGRSSARTSVIEPPSPQGNETAGSFRREPARAPDGENPGEVPALVGADRVEPLEQVQLEAQGVPGAQRSEIERNDAGEQSGHGGVPLSNLRDQAGQRQAMGRGGGGRVRD